MKFRTILGLLLFLLASLAPPIAAATPEIDNETLERALESRNEDVVKGALATLADREGAQITDALIGRVSRVAALGSGTARTMASDLLVSVGSDAGPHLDRRFLEKRFNSRGRFYRWLEVVSATRPDVAAIGPALTDNVGRLSPVWKPQIVFDAVEELRGGPGAFFAGEYDRATTDDRRAAAALLWGGVPPEDGGMTLDQAYERLQVAGERETRHLMLIIVRRTTVEPNDVDRLVELLGNVERGADKAIIVDRLAELGPRARRAGPALCAAHQVIREEPLRKFVEQVGYGPELACLVYELSHGKNVMHYELLSLLGSPGRAVLLKDAGRDGHMRFRAMGLLAQQDGSPWPILEHVRNEVMLKNPRPEAVRLWARFGHVAQPRLRELARVGNPPGRVAVSQLGKQDIDFLIERTRNSNPWLPSKRLAELSVDPVRLVDALADTFVWANQPGKLIALRLGGYGDTGWAALVHAIATEDHTGRIPVLLEAAHILWKRTGKRPEALHKTVLLIAQHRGMNGPRRAALRSLWGLTPEEAAEALPVVRAALGHPTDVDAALDAVSIMGEPAAPLLPLVLQQVENPVHRDKALDAIREMGPAAHTAVPKLLELHRADPEEWRIVAAIGGVMRSSDTAALTLLRDAFESKSHYCQWWAARGLAAHSRKPLEVLEARGVLTNAKPGTYLFYKLGG